MTGLNALWFFRVGGLVLVVCTIVMAWSTLDNSLRRSSIADDSLRRLGSFEIAFSALSAIAAERQPTEALLATQRRRDMVELQRMQAARLATDRALARLRAVPGNAEPIVAAQLSFIEARLAAERQRVDAMVAVPLSARRVGDQFSIIRGMISISETAEPFVARAATAVSDADRGLAGEVTMARLLGALHEAALRLPSEIMPTLAAGQIIPPDQAMAAYRTQQRIAALWDVGASQIEHDNQGKRFAPTLEAIRGRYFGTGFSFLSRVIERQSVRVNPALDVQQLSDLYAETTVPIAELRDLYVERMIAQAKLRQHESLLAMLATVCLAATMVAAVPGLAWIAYRQVLRPLLQIRSQLQAICDREPQPELSYAGTVPQVRSLVRAVETLWDRERERQALDVERHRLAERLKTLSETDPLTGLANRRGLDLALAAMSPNARSSLGFVLVDVDHFKSINDRFGHSSGDRVLAEVGRRLVEVIGADEIVARYGGEEFAVAVVDRPLESLLELAEAIRVAVESPPVVDPVIGSIALTVSCGAAVEPLPEARWDLVVEQADAALYEAKASGRNRVRATNGVLRRWSPAAQGDVDPRSRLAETAA